MVQVPRGERPLFTDPDTGTALTIANDADVWVEGDNGRYEGLYGLGETHLRLYRRVTDNNALLSGYPDPDSRDADTATLEYTVPPHDGPVDDPDGVLVDHAERVYDAYLDQSGAPELTVDGNLDSGGWTECDVDPDTMWVPDEHHYVTTDTTTGHRWLVSQRTVTVRFDGYGADDPDSAYDARFDY